MKLFHSFTDFNATKKTIITIGSFDGVHIGHKKIIEKVITTSKLLNYESVVLTFFPHPKIVLNKNSEHKSLNSIDEKIELLKQTSLDNLIILPFDKTFSELSAEDFVKQILIDRLNIGKIIIGYDHHFGKNRSANVNDLIQFGEKYNFEVEQISAQEINEVAVSSTKIRTALSDGNIVLANQYLGYKYMLSGIIVKGKQLGRTIGFPTANLNIEDYNKQIPKIGVYVVQSLINNKTVFGMMNIGFNPTVGGQRQTTEIHFFDFNDDLYNQKISISILTRIRNEQKFTSVEILKNQLEEDKIFSLEYLKPTKA